MKTNFKQCIGKVIAVAAYLSNEKMIAASKIFQGTIFLIIQIQKGNIPTYQPPLILQYCKLFTYIQHSRHMDAAFADCILHKIKESWKLHLDNSIQIWFRVHHISAVCYLDKGWIQTCILGQQQSWKTAYYCGHNHNTPPKHELWSSTSCCFLQ